MRQVDKRKFLGLSIALMGASLVALSWWGYRWAQTPVSPWLQVQVRDLLAEQLNHIEGLRVKNLQLRTTPWGLWQTGSLQLELSLWHQSSGLLFDIEGQVGYLSETDHRVQADLQLTVREEKEGGAPFLSSPLSAVLWLSGDPLELVRDTSWKRLELVAKDVRASFPLVGWAHLGAKLSLERYNTTKFAADINASDLQVRALDGLSASLGSITVKMGAILGDELKPGPTLITAKDIKTRYGDYLCKLGSLSSEILPVDAQASLTLQIPATECASSDENSMGMLTDFKLHLTTPLDFEALQIPEEFALRAEARELEALWGDYYVKLPLASQVLNLLYHKTPAGHRVAISDHLGHLKSKLELESGSTRAQIQGKKWALAKLKAWLPLLPELTIEEGRANFDLDLTYPSARSKAVKWDLNLKLTQTKGAYQLAKPAHFSLDQLDLPLHSRKKTQAQVQRLTLSLGDSPLVQSTDLSLTIDPAGEVKLLNSLPILHKDLLIRDFVASQREGSKWRVTAALNLPALQLDKWLVNDCVAPITLPPVVLASHTLKLYVAPDRLSLQGDLALKLFGGQLKMSDMAIHRWQSALPETQLSLDWSGLDLEQVGRWTGLGGMRGEVRGHLRETVLQGSLPTQFDFLMEAAPLSGESQIVFSPLAMKNVVGLMSPEDFTQSLPGIINWVAFGLPSRLLGGYNINYAGARIEAKDNRIFFHTLDPEQVVLKNEGRYIINGPRFKVPLQSAVYPVVIDAPAMAGFIRHVMLQLDSLKPEEETKDQQASASKEIANEGQCNSYLFGEI